MQARIAAAVDHAPIDRSRLEEIVGALWSPLDDPGASRPVLALWVSERGWRAPVEARLAVGQPMPLGLLPVPVRGLTLAAIRDLFGEDVMALEGALDRAAWLFRRAAPRRPAPAKSPRPPALWPGGERRPPADYRLLAREILAHPDWIAAAQLPERRRRRVLGRLIDAALEPGFATRSGAEAVGRQAVQRSNANAVQSFSAKIDARGGHLGALSECRKFWYSRSLKPNDFPIAQFPD